MLKEAENEETMGFFVTFLSLVAFQLGGPGSLVPSLATPMPAGILRLIFVVKCFMLIISYRQYTESYRHNQTFD